MQNFGQDGIPHLTYFDKTTYLSFVYDAEHPGRVAVSHGGYGEGVIDVFEVKLDDIDRIDYILHRFQTACHAYVRAWNTRVTIAV